MGRSFCKTIYRLIEKKGKAPCIVEDKGKICSGYIEKVREREDISFEEMSQGKTLFYRCKTCNSHWKATLDNFSFEPVFEKY